MLPIPHMILFLPICMFAGIAIAAAAMAMLAGVAPTKRVKVARPSAQIIYFTPRKTPLRSYSGHGSANLAMLRR